MAADGSISRMPVQTHSRWNRFWRYAPLVAWMAVVFLGSTDAFSTSHSGQIIRPLLLWLFPHISEGEISSVHFLIRKAGHLTEYAILGLLAARAAQLGVTPEEAEQRDFAPDSPRGNAICRMVDGSEIAYLTVFLASDKAWAVSGELVVATGGAGRSVYY